MIGNKSFSIYEQTTVTNKKLTITYTPSTSSTKYSYKIYKDDTLYEEASVSSNKSVNLILDESGTYNIKVVETSSNNKTASIESGIYKIDVDAPYIIVSDQKIIEMTQLKENEIFDTKLLKDIVRVYDKQDGDIFESLKCETKDVDFKEPGLKEVTCTVEDSAGNLTESTLRFNIKKDNTILLNTVMIFIVTFLLILILLLFKIQKSINLEKKISKYSIEPLNNKRLSMFDKAMRSYHKTQAKIKKVIIKSTVIKKHSKKFEKYIPACTDTYQDGMDFIASKIILAFILVLISIFSNAIQYKIISIYGLILPFCFGYFLPNVLYILKYKIYRDKLENDLLQAIIIMNNAFKSGRSLTQAMELVTKELEGSIGLEFKKMLLEISFGLSVETVFNRLSDRIKLEEVAYLTASLSILNKTGGNIIQVFSSIEKTLFNKKKLKLELKSLTGSSKIIIYALFAVPFLFILFISLISPGYFEPFYTTTLGLILSGLMIIIYILYVIFVKKIMTVRM